MSEKVVAAQQMRDLEKKYGKTFLEKSLHEAHFEYVALQRIMRGMDTPRTLQHQGEGGS